VQYLDVPGQPKVTAGFAPRRHGNRAIVRRTHLFVQAFAAIGLILSLAVAATAVSIGIARAQEQPCALACAHIIVTR
jgi:hypothetical protein